MKKYTIFTHIIVIVSLLTVALPTYGQFRIDVPHQNIREFITGRPEIPSLLDVQNFQIHHSFSMSMMNLGGMSVGVGAYTNSLSFVINPNLSLNTQISLVQPTMTGQQNQGNIYYGVGLNYKASENSFLSFQINNYPTYYRRPNQHFHLRGY